MIGWFELPVLVGSSKDNYRLVFPTNLTGTIVKGVVVPEVSGTQKVYDGVRQGVSAVAMVDSNNLAVVTKYWGLSNTVYPTNELGPIDAGVYGVEVKVAESEQNYGGATNVVLTIGKRSAVIAAGSDTIRAGTVFNSNNYSYSGFLTNIVTSDVPRGSLVTHLRGVTNTNPLVGYSTTNNQSGVYRILRGDVGENVSSNYSIEYREGTLTVLRQSVMTEGTVVPLGAGSGFTLMVMSNRSVTNWGSTLLGVVPDVINPGKVGTAGFIGANGVGVGSGSEFGMAWTLSEEAVVWGATNNNAAVTQKPTNLVGLVGLSGGVDHVVYHQEQGSNRVAVAGAWGTNGSGQTNVPEVLRGSGAGVVGVSAGQNFGLAVRTNGQVMAWGSPVGGVTTVPVGVSNVVGLAAGTYHGVALKGDGTVAAWGFPVGATSVPGELTNRGSNNFVRAVAVAAGGEGVLVLRADGSLRAWGAQSWAANLPLAVSNNPWVSVSASSTHAVGMRQDGTVVVWGNTNGAITNVAGLKGLVPMGGADSDGDGWANEAELRVGSDPLSTNSYPMKASFGVNFSYGSNVSTFTNSRTVMEGSNRVVGTLAILDTMGRLEDGNQAEMTVELSEESLKTFEPVSRTNRELRFKSAPVYDGVTSNNVYKVEVLVKDNSRSTELTTELTVNVGNVAPQITGNTSFAIDENVAEGTVVGTLAATESNVTWSITSGNGLGLFAIDGQTGQIRTAGAINYEDEALSSSNPITLGVRVTDAGELPGSANVTITVRDVDEGMTPQAWLAGSGWTEMSPELWLKYAVGGALSPTGSSENTVTVLDSEKLSLTAIIRTNDLSLRVLGEAGVDLTSWQTNGVSVAPTASQDGVPDGSQRRIYSVDRTNSPSRQFLRLRVTR